MINGKICWVLGLMLSLACGAFLTSCKNDAQELETAVIDVKVDVETSALTSDFFSGWDYVALETNDSCLIHSVRRYEFNDSLIVIQSGCEILTFDRKGKFKSVFNRQGQGPEEYVHLDAFRLCNGLIYILDCDVRAISVYKTGGDFVRKIKLDSSYIDFFMVDEDEIVLASGCYNSTKYAFAWADGNGEVKSRAGHYSQVHTVIMWDYTPFAGKRGDNLVVNAPFILTSFELGEFELDPIANYTFNTPKQLPELTLETVDINKMVDITKNQQLVRQLGHYCIKDSIAFQSFGLFELSSGGYGANLVKYDARTGAQIAQIRLGVTESSEFPYIWGGRVGFYEDCLTEVRRAGSLLDTDDRNGSDFWATQGLTEDSNPVIFFYKLK